MNTKFPLYLLLFVLMTGIAASCNDEVKDVIEGSSPLSNNTAITDFSLKADEAVLLNLDSVYFSIDLNNRRIYNADSLPKGTKISGLLIDIEHDSESSVEIVQRNGTVRRDTVFKYSDADSIDFTGNVSLKVTAADGNEVYYTVKVNVHNLDPDSMYWNQMARRDLPNAQGEVLAQKTVKYANEAYCLVNSANGGYVLSKISNPINERWTKIDAQFGFIPNVMSLEATDNALYVLDEDGNLYTSVDGQSWTSCGVTWTNILGGYTDRVLGVALDGGVYKHDEYPRPQGFEPSAVDATFPVKESSQMTYYSNEWDLMPQALLVGGIDQKGKYHGDCWGYDGNVWTLLRTNVLPSLAGMTVFQYSTYETYTGSSRVIEHRSWLAMGGHNVKGEVNRKVYVSRHQGLYWNEGDESLQLPEYIDAFHGAQGLVFSAVMTPRSTDDWVSMPSGYKPAWAYTTPRMMTRASTAIVTWECPYIYLFGGINEDGMVQNNIWRGVLNRLTFKPII